MRLSLLFASFLLAWAAGAAASVVVPRDLCQYRYKQIQGWKSEAEALDAALENLPDDQRQGYRDVIDALYFIDYRTAAPDLLDRFLNGRPMWKAQFPQSEGSGLRLLGWHITEGHSALENYRAARRLLEKVESIDGALLSRLHAQLFSGDKKAPEAGRYRQGAKEEVEKALADFKSTIEGDQKPKEAEAKDTFVRAAARLHQQIVTLRPFGEGSDRAATVLLNHLLTSAGLPPARILDAQRAVAMSAEAWAEEVLMGIQSTQNFQADLAKRLREGKPVSDSVEWVTPLILREVVVPHQTGGRKYRDPASRVAPVSAGQFAAYLKVRIQREPELRTRLKENPVETLAQVHEDYRKYLETKRLDFKHKTAGEEELELNLVEPEYYAEFAVPRYTSLSEWEAKMNRWHRPELVWRGLSYQSRVMEEAEIVSMFSQIHPQMVSNQLLGAGTSHPGRLRKLALADFDRYNRDLVSGELRNMAKDHSETGPLYGTSYGLSTSRRKVVGDGFAMGAMVVAPYGQHRAPEHQMKLSDRIVVGAYRGKKDVDLARLKQLDPQFSYKYARQMEVMGIGAMDPDSILIVQRLDAKGVPVVTYARNPKQPAEIWVIDGDFDPDAGKPPAKSKLLRAITLPTST